MIAMALANEPDLFIADEPTTALDVTVAGADPEAPRRAEGAARHGMLFITHDLGIVRKVADRVCVMTKGKIVERAGRGHVRRPSTPTRGSCSPPSRRAAPPVATLRAHRGRGGAA